MPVVRDTLTTGLQARVQAALASLDATAVIAYVDYAVKSRTQRGQFLPGSSPGAGQYSTGHKRTREKRGLQTARVDLLMTGRMLDATRGQTTTFADQVRIEYGYLDGLSEVEATRLATYHNVLGAGRSGVVRRFIGLTDSERQKALDILADAFRRAL